MSGGQGNALSGGDIRNGKKRIIFEILPFSVDSQIHILNFFVKYLYLGSFRQ